MKEFVDAADQAAGYLLAIVMALCGRLLAVASQKPSLGWALLLELPVAIGMGVIGAGIAEGIDLHGKAASALIAALAFLGPATLTTLLNGALKRGGLTK